ncbi:RHS repeat-associated core domain-containing protein [Chryseobacterium sp. MEBOG06]|uniref:RHS repeat-associated core domain-containing protein n=1 Tax=Chryseobacterium sp. MEBOG06 TaxID=2879938 RepID=UPI001F405549|nr:RHS repeat-associated core domain-containing protein [Chryseobacterium sp. MEBOG06]UKB86095.1 RHS repeat-associated core domain-containing protein [Chryseobacterium sp. MEBOG06]
MPGNTATLVDNLDYIYNGNRLTQVIENAMNDTGYEGGNNIIDYDLNGSMTTMKDKGIQSIAYNHLNLPDLFSINQNNPLGGLTSFGLSYLYRADGTKVRKTYTSGGGKGQNKTTKMTDYLDGFQYNYIETSGPCLWCKTSVAYEAEAYRDKNIFDPGIISPIWLLDFVPTAEGFYSFIENRYIYQYKDHLGNARVSFAKDSTGTPEITDTNNYYAFGMNHIGGVKGLLGGYMNYKYNGKELQETGMYDYGARMYMPDIGRWGVVDPLAEKMRRHSPYNYTFNNPIRFTDPDGRQADDWRNKNGQLVYDRKANDGKGDYTKFATDKD